MTRFKCVRCHLIFPPNRCGGKTKGPDGKVKSYCETCSKQVDGLESEQPKTFGAPVHDINHLVGEIFRKTGISLRAARWAANWTIEKKDDDGIESTVHWCENAKQAKHYLKGFLYAITLTGEGKP